MFDLSQDTERLFLIFEPKADESLKIYENSLQLSRTLVLQFLFSTARGIASKTVEDDVTEICYQYLLGRKVRGSYQCMVLQDMV
jgi:hypothetical protein